MKNDHAEGGAPGAMLIEVPAELKELWPVLEELVGQAAALARQIGGHRRVDYAEVERQIAGLVGAVERSTHSSMLTRLDEEAERVEINGKAYRRVGRGPGDYYTRTGKISVTRTLYRECGVRSGPTVDAISLRTGCFGTGWLPETARQISFLVQEDPCRRAAKTAAELGLLPYCAASFDRVAHELGQEWMQRHAALEGEMMAEFELPGEAAAISMSLDRASVPMEKPRKRRPGRPRKGDAKRPVERHFRMAYCGTVTIHDSDGDAIHTLKYACMPDGNIGTMIAGMVDDACDIMAKAKTELRLVNLADGAHEIWTLLREAQTGRIEVCRELVDYYHLVEKLAACTPVIFGSESMIWLNRWRRNLLDKPGAAEKIRRLLVDSGKSDALVGDKRPVHEAITYLTNHAERFDYASAQRDGLPIGSGVVEACCKTVVAGRMKRAGARWKDGTGEHVIRLRALATSDGDRWDQAMRRLHAARSTAVVPIVSCAG